jgi:hypothetical protein
VLDFCFEVVVDVETSVVVEVAGSDAAGYIFTTMCNRQRGCSIVGDDRRIPVVAALVRAL